MPKYFLAFAPYATYDVPNEPWQVPVEAEFPKMAADDIRGMALPLDDMPDWQNKSKGNGIQSNGIHRLSQDPWGQPIGPPPLPPPQSRHNWQQSSDTWQQPWRSCADSGDGVEWSWNAQTGWGWWSWTAQTGWILHSPA